MITVNPHPRSREDRAGDPLDGLVNLFDLGIVLSVAFGLSLSRARMYGQDLSDLEYHAAIISDPRTAGGAT